MKKIILLMMVTILLVGCHQGTSQEIRDLEQEIEKLKVELVLLEGMKSKIDDLEAQVMSLEMQLTGGVTTTTVYEPPSTLDFMDPFEMTELEYELYDKFVYGEYNHVILEDLSPLSIFKMYIYSDFMEDYKTQYQFFIENEALSMTLEDYIQERESTGLKDFDIYFDVYNVKVNEEDDHAEISWQSKNGQTDDMTYIFKLRKEGKIWRVEFLPMD